MYYYKKGKNKEFNALWDTHAAEIQLLTSVCNVF